MVAQYGQRAHLAHQLHHPVRVRSLGHQVAGQDHAFAAHNPALAQESLQFIQAAMDVADDDGSFHDTHSF